MKNINNFEIQKIKYYSGGGYLCSHKIHKYIMGDGFSIGEAIRNYKSAFQMVRLIEKKPIEYNKTKIIDFSENVEKEDTKLIVKNIKIKEQKELVFNF